VSLIDRVGAHHKKTISRADAVTLEEFGALLGRGNGAVKSSSGVAMTPNRALGISAWYRGVRYLSETVASLPTFTYRRSGSSNRSRRVSPPWLASPGADLTWFAILEFIVMSLVHNGNAFLWKVRSPTGQVVGLLPIHPDDVKFGVADNRKVFLIRRGSNREWLPATTFEVLHIPALSTDGFFGIDPIRTFANSLGIVAAADEYAGTFYANGAHLGSYVSMPGRLEDDVAEATAAQWERLHKGLSSAHSFGVIGDGATYHTIGLDADQMQLLGTRRFGVTEVARMLGVVPHKLYDLERSTFSNIEHQAIESVTDGIRPLVTRIEAWINADRSLVREGNFVEIELEGLLRGDIKTRYEAYSIATGGPWMEGNTPRRLENLPEREELDVVLRPLAMGVASDEAEADATEMSAAEVLQKIYLAVGSVITVDEARQIAIGAGANLSGPGPQEA
jgi:HK97 family phage portal protein